MVMVPRTKHKTKCAASQQVIKSFTYIYRSFQSKEQHTILYQDVSETEATSIAASGGTPTDIQ